MSWEICRVFGKVMKRSGGFLDSKRISGSIVMQIPPKRRVAVIVPRFEKTAAHCEELHVEH
ncbi:hypothetical protein [Pseudomonas sp. BR20]|uniref:hypothetical protein n=1 Tax=Pseudomonas sp. BR20 TaxID=3137452 RepID=UPI003D6E7EBB